MDEKEAEARPLLGTIFLVTSIPVIWNHFSSYFHTSNMGCLQKGDLQTPGSRGHYY